MPFGQEPPEGERPPNGSNPRSTRRRRRKNRHGPPSSEPSSYGAEEQAESEVPTLDPSVDPEAFEAAPEPPRPQPRREVREARQGALQAAGGGGSGGSPAGSPAGSHGGSKSNSTSWMSAMGPQKGVKFRGGGASTTAYLAISTWRCTSLWEIWKKGETVADADPLLHDPCRGRIDVVLVPHRRGGTAAGILPTCRRCFMRMACSFVVDQLKSAFQQKSVYVKRHVLHEYEHIYRFNLETLRGYINRYRRIEASLMSIGIDVSLTYDSEARGSRLLDRAKLSLEQQRMVLVGTGQRLDFDTVASALCMPVSWV